MRPHVDVTFFAAAKVFTIDEIVEAHRTMEENKAGGNS